MIGSPSSPSQQSTEIFLLNQKIIFHNDLTLDTATPQLESVDVSINAALSSDLVASEVSVVRGSNPVVRQRLRHLLTVHSVLDVGGDRLLPLVEHQEVSEALLGEAELVV